MARAVVKIIDRTTTKRRKRKERTVVIGRAIRRTK